MRRSRWTPLKTRASSPCSRGQRSRTAPQATPPVPPMAVELARPSLRAHRTFSDGTAVPLSFKSLRNQHANATVGPQATKGRSARRRERCFANPRQVSRPTLAPNAQPCQTAFLSNGRLPFPFCRIKAVALSRGVDGHTRHDICIWSVASASNDGRPALAGEHLARPTLGLTNASAGAASGRRLGFPQRAYGEIAVRCALCRSVSPCAEVHATASCRADTARQASGAYPSRQAASAQ